MTPQPQERPPELFPTLLLRAALEWFEVRCRESPPPGWVINARWLMREPDGAPQGLDAWDEHRAWEMGLDDDGV